MLDDDFDDDFLSGLTSAVDADDASPLFECFSLGAASSVVFLLDFRFVGSTAVAVVPPLDAPPLVSLLLLLLLVDFELCVVSDVRRFGAAGAADGGGAAGAALFGFDDDFFSVALDSLAVAASEREDFFAVVVVVAAVTRDGDERVAEASSCDALLSAADFRILVPRVAPTVADLLLFFFVASSLAASGRFAVAAPSAVSSSSEDLLGRTVSALTLTFVFLVVASLII